MTALVTYAGEEATFSFGGAVAGLISISGPNVSVDAVDVTSCGDEFKKFRPHKQKNYGTVTAECYLTTATSAWVDTVGTVDQSFTVGTGTGGPSYGFTGFVLSAEISGLDAGGSEAKITIEIQVTSEIS